MTRTDRLMQNWRRRATRIYPSLSRDELREKADQLHKDFVAFENKVESRIGEEEGRPERNRWDEVVKQMLEDNRVKRDLRDAYRLLTEHEWPGELEMEPAGK
jgi:hypothetical protein